MDRRKVVRGTDDISVNVDDVGELKYWAQKFNVSRDEIKSAVKAVGVSLTAVERKIKLMQKA
ncbi:DUF3606 domain-containing protein [Pseudomonas sp. DSP3-2-2]|uniref:DUF3606 domain-containing protein n=1 Tax=unclassified Pseudomonas TaxID=196821 RepID=UPI003CE6E918